METDVKRTYEGMFMVDSALAAQDWQKAIDEITRILNRAQAEIVSMRKWDERRLCYDIEGKSRATYILVYFNCQTDKLAAIDRDIQLSEVILRALVLKADMIKKEDMEKPTPAEINPVHEEGQETSATAAAPAEKVAPAKTEAAPSEEAAPAKTEAAPAEEAAPATTEESPAEENA